MGRRADQWQKLIVAAFAASLAGYLLYWLVAAVGLMPVHALGGEAAVLLMQFLVRPRLGRPRLLAVAPAPRLRCTSRFVRRCPKRATSFRHSLGCGDEVHSVVRGFCVMMDLNVAQARPAKGALVINRGVTIIGALSLDGQMLIEGTIDGEVRCSALQITERGEVEGLIVADRSRCWASSAARSTPASWCWAPAATSRARSIITSWCWKKAAISRGSPAATAIR